jgi:hypothetical protein
VSLILEALRKLEREKQAPERGVVVVGAAAWPGARSERRIGLFLLGLALGGVALGLAYWRQRAGAPVPAPPVTLAVRAPVVRPTPEALAPPAQDARPPERRVVAAPKAAATAEATRPAEPAFTLQAISERDGRPVALVNDRLVREGDSIDGARIVRIARDEVELDLGGRRLTLRF